KIRELITRATADKSKATVSAILGHWSVLTPGACFHLLLLSFSGTWELPRLSLWRLKRCRRSPYLTSYSPRSCKHGCQCRYWHKSSATCADKRICPASPQSSTRCATLIPEPAMFVFSLTSVTRLFGPLLPPIRNRLPGQASNALQIRGTH